MKLFVLTILLGIIKITSSQTSVDGTIRNVGDSNANFQKMVSETKALLNFGEFSTYVQKSGAFQFNNIPNGIYHLTLKNSFFDYPTYQVKVDDGRYKVFAFNMTSRHKHVVDSPINVIPQARTQYFDIREPFDIGSILKSPFGMIIGFTVLMMFCMKNMPDMDELQGADEPSQAQQPARRQKN